MCLFYNHLPLCGHGPGVMLAGPFCPWLLRELDRRNVVVRRPHHSFPSSSCPRSSSSSSHQPFSPQKLHPSRGGHVPPAKTLGLPFNPPKTCEPLPGYNVIVVLDRNVGVCGGYCGWECRNSFGERGLWTMGMRMGMPGAGAYGRRRDGVGWRTE